MKKLMLSLMAMWLTFLGCKDDVGNSNPDYEGVASVSITMENIPEDYLGNKLYAVTFLNDHVYAAIESESQNGEVIMAASPDTSAPFDIVLYLPESGEWIMNENMALGYYSKISGIRNGDTGYIANGWSYGTNQNNVVGGINASIEVEFVLPADLELFAGEILNIDASVTNNSEEGTISSVRYLFNQSQVATYTETPYEYKLNTLGLAPGEYSLTVEAENSLGFSAVDEASFRVLESGANQAPSVTIQNPAHGAVLSQENIYNITASVTDDEGTEGIAYVEFMINGFTRQQLYSAPWTYQWDAATSSTGTVEIKVTATDVHGSTRHDVINVSLRPPTP